MENIQTCKVITTIDTSTKGVYYDAWVPFIIEADPDDLSASSFVIRIDVLNNKEEWVTQIDRFAEPRFNHLGKEVVEAFEELQLDGQVSKSKPKPKPKSKKSKPNKKAQVSEDENSMDALLTSAKK